MANGTKNAKNILRKEYKTIREGILENEKLSLDKDICKQITSLASFRFADTLLTYSPIGSEIDVTPVTLEALKRGKKVAFPVCDPESCTMTFRYVSDLSELVCGSYNIKEPPSNAPSFDNVGFALCIVPALSFDNEGYRLGYGKGYYDRFLRSFRGSSLGAVYEQLLAKALPRGYYDLPVEIIVTERRSMITNAGKEKIGIR